MRKKRLTAGILASVLLISSVCYISETHKNKDNTAYILQEKDRKTAQELSDATGESVENLSLLRSERESWNEVLSAVQAGEMNHRFMTDEQLQALISQEDFSEDMIKDATDYVAQIVFYLEEISREDTNTPAKPTSVPAGIKEEQAPKEDTEEYQLLYQKLDKNLAIYLCLKLQPDFQSAERVMDEYLYCLQVDEDILVYLEDKEKYEETLSKKVAVLMREKAITIQDISNFMMKRMNQIEGTDQGNEMVSGDQEQKQTMDSVLPKVVNPRPEDPAKQVMDEIYQIQKNIYKS